MKTKAIYLCTKCEQELVQHVMACASCENPECERCGVLVVDYIECRNGKEDYRFGF